MTDNIRENTRRGAYTPSIMAELRALMPIRPLTFLEAKTVAELQANRLLKLTKSISAPICEAIVTELPRVEVRRVGSLIGSGATAWSRGLWRVRINGAEPLTRQRFTLAHELKHILDAASEDATYGHLPKGIQKRRHIEAVCDHFAACLLMPKRLVQKAWSGGQQDLAGLAWQFEVSQQAMLIRLQNLGLVEPIPRHAAAYRLGGVAVRGSRYPQARRRKYVPVRYQRMASYDPSLTIPHLQGVLS